MEQLPLAVLDCQLYLLDILILNKDVLEEECPTDEDMSAFISTALRQSEDKCLMFLQHNMHMVMNRMQGKLKAKYKYGEVRIEFVFEWIGSFNGDQSPV